MLDQVDKENESHSHTRQFNKDDAELCTHEKAACQHGGADFGGTNEGERSHGQETRHG